MPIQKLEQKLRKRSFQVKQNILRELKIETSKLTESIKDN